MGVQTQLQARDGLLVVGTICRIGEVCKQVGDGLRRDGYTRADQTTGGLCRRQGEAEQLVGKPVWDRAVFMGRIGAGPPAQARSLRRPLANLIIVP